MPDHKSSWSLYRSIIALLKPLRAAYSLSFNWAIKSTRRFFLESLNLGKDDILADLGGGSGIWTREFAPHVKKVLLLDKETGAEVQGSLSEARTLAQKKDIQNALYIKADVLALPLANSSLDKVLCAEVLEHVADPRNALAEMARVLKDHGMALITTTPNAELIESYTWPVWRLAQKLLPPWLKRKNVFLREGYERFEAASDHIHRFIPAQLEALGASIGLRAFNRHQMHKPGLGMAWMEFSWCVFLTWLKSSRPLLFQSTCWRTKVIGKG